MTATIKDLIENLERLPNTDAVRRKNNSYALNEKEEITALSLSNSKVTAITLTEDALALEHLYLNANESLETIYFTAALPHLKHLYIEECALKELAIPAGCKGLEQLYARKNKLQQVDFKGDCPALELLDLSDNELKKISINHDFERLKYLYLGSSHIEELHLFTTLPSLNTLHLENNRLKKVPQLIIDKILNDDAIFETLDLRSNTPENIPKVFVGKYSFYKSSLNCIEKARLWFEELRDNKPTGKNKTIKLMLLGNGNAGKTSLVCALDKGKCTHEHPTTHGIQIQPLTFDDVTYHIWDFGGQEVYHGTHKLFMESVALQLILFDPETEERANKSIKKPDRANEKPVRDYPIKYWYDTTFSKSEESLFILVQNKVDEFPVVDKENRNFSDGKAEFIHISAKEGTRVNILKGLLKEEARKLPEYGMEMPQSWLTVRDFFSNNLDKGKDSIKLLTENAFKETCKKENVSVLTYDLLRDYLHHNGFIYYNKSLKNEADEQVIIVDQRWALKAIYKPYDRAADHYEEFSRLKGQIQVSRLFRVFDLRKEGEEDVNYSKEDKWLFLDFMRVCGLCFQINDRPWQKEKSERDYYVFPEFLPEQAPQIVLNLWDTTKDYWIFRYRLPYRNYGMIQSFIVALGRKTELDNIWRTGIHIARKEGNFKVALEQEGAEHNLMIYIDKTVVKDRLVFIFDTLRGDLKGGSWELSVDIGQQYQPFDLKDWKKNTQRESEALEQQESRAAVDRKTIVNENVKKKQSKKAKKKAKKKSKKNAGRIGHEVGNKKLKDEEQWRNVPRDILFAAANPSEKARMATDKEHETIEKEMRLGDERHLYNIKKPLLAVTFDNLMRAIQKLDRPNIIHFAGHGIEQGIIIVDDNNNSEVLRNDLLEDIFKEFGERTELVILNCCYSAAQAALISKLGILVIGYNTEIGDSAAIKFIKGFYVGISQGKSYKKAFALGRIYLKQKKSASLNKLEVWLNGSILKW